MKQGRGDRFHAAEDRRDPLPLRNGHARRRARCAVSGQRRLGSSLRLPNDDAQDRADAPALCRSGCHLDVRGGVGARHPGGVVSAQRSASLLRKRRLRRVPRAVHPLPYRLRVRRDTHCPASACRRSRDLGSGACGGDGQRRLRLARLADHGSVGRSTAAAGPVGRIRPAASPSHLDSAIAPRPRLPRSIRARRAPSTATRRSFVR